MDPGLFSIGYGNRSMDALLGLLHRHAIATVVDVRSVPHSAYHPEFGRGPLAGTLQTEGITYQWMGDRLGGRCGTEAPATPAFRSSLRRLALMGSDRRVAFLCAEARPEACHRVHVVAASLEDQGVAVRHIDEHGLVQAHHDVLRRVTHGQVTLEGRPVLVAA